MGIEFIAVKEMGNIAATQTEFSAITRIVNSEVGPGTFASLFNTMMQRMADSYGVVIETLQPLTDMDGEDRFNEDFDDKTKAFRDGYLLAISKARSLTVDAYDDYEHLVCMREAKTGYPLLKRTFSRLAELTDKWIANDYWLAMSIDTLFKMLPRLLKEIEDLKARDPADAYLIYQSAFGDIGRHLSLIRQQQACFLDAIVEPDLRMEAG